MRDPRHSRITIACETCDVQIVLSAQQLAAENEMDDFVQAHSGHRVTMTATFDPPPSSAESA